MEKTELINKKNKIYLLSEEESRRINILKVWLTVMVVFIHSYSEVTKSTVGNIQYSNLVWLEILKYTISQAISRCAVPGFFMIASILLYKKAFIWKENIKKKAKTLLIPYVILNSFWILLFFIIQRIPSILDFFPNKDTIIANWDLIKWLDAYIGFINGYPTLYPLWFIRDLFVLNVLSSVIKKIIDWAPNTLFFALLMMWLFLSGTHLFFLDIQGICFWGLGYLIVKKNISISKIDIIKPWIIIFVYVFGITLDVLTRTSFLNLFVHRFNIIVGIIFWFSCMTKYKSENLNKILVWLSSYSFSIYLFHEVNLTILKKLLSSICPPSAIFMALNYLIIPFIIIFCCLILSMSLKKFFPKLYVTITGNRIK